MNCIVEKFTNFVNSKVYVPHHISNCDETELFENSIKKNPFNPKGKNLYLPQIDHGQVYITIVCRVIGYYKVESFLCKLHSL